MGLTGAYNSPLDDDVVAHAFRRGVTFFDTSDVYGPHTNETLLGKVVRPALRLFVFLHPFSILFFLSRGELVSLSL